MTDNAPLLLVDVHDSVALVTLNRPDAYNALNPEITLAIVKTFEQIAIQDSIKAVVLTGAGKAFCAGVDLKALTGNGSMLADGGLGPESPMVVAMKACNKPIVGAVNGAAVTGGFELALACDFLYASPKARFADTHARVGILPGWGLSQKLSRIIGINRAREYSLSGNFINAEQALEWGLVNKLCSEETLIEEAMGIAQQMAEANPEAVPALKALINDGWEMDLGDALELEGERANVFIKTVDFSQMEATLNKLRARAAKQ